MAWAAKCDRCGKYYQEVIDGRHDLCPDCMKSLEGWFKEVWSEKLQERLNMSHEEWLRTEYEI